MDESRNRPESVAADMEIDRPEYQRSNVLQEVEFCAMDRRKRHAAYIEEALRRVRAEFGSR